MPIVPKRRPQKLKLRTEKYIETVRAKLHTRREIEQEAIHLLRSLILIGKGNTIWNVRVRDD